MINSQLWHLEYFPKLHLLHFVSKFQVIQQKRQQFFPLILTIRIDSIYFPNYFLSKSRISLLKGIAGAVPSRVTEMAAVADPKRTASISDIPSANA